MLSRGKLLVELARNVYLNDSCSNNGVHLQPNASSANEETLNSSNIQFPSNAANEGMPDTGHTQSQPVASSAIEEMPNTCDTQPQPNSSSVVEELSANGVENSYYIVQHSSGTKLHLKRGRNFVSYDEIDSSEGDGDFSSGSSDEYVPPRSEKSLNSSTSSEDEATKPQLFPVAERSETNSPTVIKKGKKRLRHPENWKKVKAKFLKNSGKSYVSRSGKSVNEKAMGPACSDKCALSCSKKITEDKRAEMFQKYWDLASLQRQRDFLSSRIQQLQLKYRRVSAGKPRKPNCGFYLLIEGQEIRVCKTFMINTFGITERTLRTVIAAKAEGCGIAPTDKRGRHGKHKKIDAEILRSVREHINSIPRIESHYVRSNTSREFIDGGLSIAEMHRNYKEQRLDKPAATYDVYARIFNTEFNIGFFLPKKDQCDLCEGFNNATADEKETLKSDYYEHHEEKDLSRAEKSLDKEKAKKKEIVLAVYDLQAVLPVPMGQTSAFFYKSRLNCYNFTISEITQDRSLCYFWHEGLGNRGAIEIGSCVFMFLQELAEMYPGSDVVFYSDNCGGQQKNRFMFGMYAYAVEHLNINSITHKYLIRGHTQNEGDAVHSIIEKSLKKAKKSGPVYVPDQYVSLIRNAKKSGNPLTVKELTYDDFIDLKALNDEMALNFAKNVNRVEIKISEIKMFRVEKESEVFWYKTSYKHTDWERAEIKLKKRRSVETKPIKDIVTKKAYTAKLPIADNKKEGLQSLMRKNLIKKFYHNFYDSLF